ncbi:MAG: transcription antitermination factor NusB [bacterium]|nr:transcription antitermination factor NusB [bacterium]
MGKRRKSRMFTLQMLYQYEMRRDGSDEIARDFWADHPKVHKDIRDYANRIFSGTVAYLSNIDGIIGELSLNWKITRLSLVDKCILRFAIYEICFSDDVPVKVAIDEAIEVAKRFSSEESSAFINGILDAVAQDQEQYLKKLSAAPS